MDPGIVVIFMFGFTAVTLSVRAIANAAVKHEENKLKYQHGGSSSATDARLERMEHALDSIAVEVERISEGQRFTTRLLSERTHSQS